MDLVISFRFSQVEFVNYIKWRFKKIISEVSSVDRGSPAERADLRPGDYLVKVEDALILFLEADEINQSLVIMF